MARKRRKRKKVAIAGAGPGGLEAARVAGSRRHDAVIKDDTTITSKMRV